MKTKEEYEKERESIIAKIIYIAMHQPSNFQEVTRFMCRLNYIKGILLVLKEECIPQQNNEDIPIIKTDVYLIEDVWEMCKKSKIDYGDIWNKNIAPNKEGTLVKVTQEMYPIRRILSCDVVDNKMINDSLQPKKELNSQQPDVKGIVHHNGEGEVSGEVYNPAGVKHDGVTQYPSVDVIQNKEELCNHCGHLKSEHTKAYEEDLEKGEMYGKPCKCLVIDCGCKEFQQENKSEDYRKPNVKNDNLTIEQNKNEVVGVVDNLNDERVATLKQNESEEVGIPLNKEDLEYCSSELEHFMETGETIDKPCKCHKGYGKKPSNDSLDLLNEPSDKELDNEIGKEVDKDYEKEI